MTKYREPSRPALLAAVLMRALPGANPRFVAQAIDAGIAAAKAHKRDSENECSYEWANTEAYRKRAENRLAKLAKHAETLLFDAAESINSRPLIAVSSASSTVARWEAPPPPSVRVSTDGQGVVRIGEGGRYIRFVLGGDPRGACGWLFVSDADGDSFNEFDGRRGFALYDK